MVELLEYQFSFVVIMCLTMETFCCCISLESGAKIISVVTTLKSILVLVLYGSAAVLLNLSQVKFLAYTVMAISAALKCLFGILLCIAVFQRRPKLMWPWLVMGWLIAGLLLGACIVGYAWVIAQGTPLTVNTNLTISAYVIYSLFLIYCCSVINSRRLELVQELDQKAKDIEATRMFLRYPSAFKYA